MDRTERSKFLSLLAQAFPNASTELCFSGEFQLVCAVLLSAQCTDKKVNQTTPILFAAYPGFKELSHAKLASVEEIIRPINYYKSKAKHLIGMAQRVVSEFGGKLPRTRSDLESLPGVGRKTASVVLGELGIEPALPVDTHVFRVARRLGLSNGETRESVEKDLTELFEAKDWRRLHHGLILHGRKTCKAQRPLCMVCPFKSICPSAP